MRIRPVITTPSVSDKPQSGGAEARKRTKRGATMASPSSSSSSSLLSRRAEPSLPLLLRPRRSSLCVPDLRRRRFEPHLFVSIRSGIGIRRGGFVARSSGSSPSEAVAAEETTGKEAVEEEEDVESSRLFEVRFCFALSRC